MILKYFLLFLLSISNALGSADVFETAYWHTAIDEYARSPQWEMKKFHKISLGDDIKFYDNKDFKGKFIAYLFNASAITFADGTKCETVYQEEVLKLKEWKVCQAYNCHLIQKKHPEEVRVINFKEKKWVNYSNNPTEISGGDCKHRVELSASGGYRNESGDSLIINQDIDSPIKIDGKIVYPDLRFCKKHPFLCRFNTDNSQEPYSLVRTMEMISKPGIINEISDELISCVSSKEPAKCLPEFTMTRSQFLNLAPENPEYITPAFFSPVSWTKEKIEEIKACVLGKKLLRSGFYKGIKMKCYLREEKIGVVDYPEAFFKFDDDGLAEKGFNVK